MPDREEIGVLGEQEQTVGTVTLRRHGEKEQETMPRTAFKARLLEAIRARAEGVSGGVRGPKPSAFVLAVLLASGGGCAAPRHAGNPVIDGWYADPEGVVLDGRYWIFPTFSAPYD